jgi:hypothetical protein
MLITMKTSLVVAAAILAFSSAQASKVGSAVSNPSVISEDVKSSFTGLSAVEIPAQAAKIIKAAKNEDRLATTKMVLNEVLHQRPQLAVQLTASIVRVAPETASHVVSWASTIVPQFGDQIIRAASLYAPQFANDIIASAIRVFPADAARIMGIVALTTNQTSKSPVRLSSGPVAQTVAGGGTIITRNGIPIGTLAPVTQDGEDEPELVFFPVDLVNINQFQAGAPGTDVNRIPEEIQEEIVEAIREQIVAKKIENYKTENGLGESDEVDQSVVDGFTNEVASTPVNLQETLEISPDLDLSDYTL